MARLLLAGTLVAPEDSWVLWTVIIVFAAVSIWLEQNYKWAERISGPIIGLILAVIATNTKILPTEAPTYDAIWEFCIPLSVAMLLFKADIRKIIKSTGQAFISANIAAVGTVIGAVVAFLALRNFIPDLHKMSGVMTASYIGGGVNFFAVADTIKPSADIIGAAIVADNFVMALAFLLLLWIPGSLFFRKHFKHPHELEVESRGKSSDAKTLSAAYWGKKEISLMDLALTVGVAFVIAATAKKIAVLLGGLLGGNASILGMILGNHFVILTVFSVVLSSLFPKFFSNLKGAQEIGTFMIYLFFVAIGLPANLWLIISQSPLLFVFCLIMALFNILTLLGVGKLFKFNIEELMLASNATLGGPSTAGAMAVAKGWERLVVPGILIGLWGYIIGTPVGILVSNWLGSW